MLHFGTIMLLSLSLYQELVAELAEDLLAQLGSSFSIDVIFLPAILSGTTALLVKYIHAMRILPFYKIVTGSFLVLVVSWYIDRICKNNTYVLVRSVGFAMILGAAAAFVLITDDNITHNPWQEHQQAVEHHQPEANGNFQADGVAPAKGRPELTAEAAESGGRAIGRD